MKHLGSDVKSCKCRMCKMCKARKPKDRYKYFARRRNRRLVKRLLAQGRWEEIPEKFTSTFEG